MRVSTSVRVHRIQCAGNLRGIRERIRPMGMITPLAGHEDTFIGGVTAQMVSHLTLTSVYLVPHVYGQVSDSLSTSSRILSKMKYLLQLSQEQFDRAIAGKPRNIAISFTMKASRLLFTHDTLVISMNVEIPH